METYEFKLRMIGDDRQWEDIPPHDRQQFNLWTEAYEYATDQALNDAVVEIRFNAADSQQGHYVAGTADAQAAHRANAEAATMRGLAVSDIL